MAQLQAIADDSPQVRAQRKLQEVIDNSPKLTAQRQRFEWQFGRAADLLGDRAGAPLAQHEAVQMEIDTSSSPSLPSYGENETPHWAHEQGVPEWAKEEYIEEAQRTVVCSVKNGKIGSMYFDDESRIRTTHSSGPAHEKHEEWTTVQYNLDEKKAFALFKKLHPKQARSKNARYRYRLWLSNALNNTPVDKLPSWVTVVDSPNKAMDLSNADSSGSTKLFEVFTSINGRVEGWHPSRGVAAKFETDKQVISVLNAAIGHIANVKGTEARNKAFYAFVESRLPRFAPYMRTPDKV